MQVKFKAYVVGAQYFDIADEKSGEVKRYSRLYTLSPASPGKPDQVGMLPGLIRCNSEVLRTLAGKKLPLECEVTADMEVNGKGVARPVISGVA